MARLRDVERHGGVTTKYYLHDDKKLTVETSQDVEPVFSHVKHQTETERRGDFRYKAEIPMTLLLEECKQEAHRSGLRLGEMVSEVMKGKTDRAQKIWKKLSEERDFSKIQARTYR